MMGEYFSTQSRPRCCYCGQLAMGRICYVNTKNVVVDNPFCGPDFGKIYTQTSALLDEILKNKIAGDYILIQKWKSTSDIPNMPTTPAQIMCDGAKRK